MLEGLARATRLVRGGLDHRTRSLPPSRRLRFALALRALGRHVAGAHADVLDAGAGEGLLAETVARRHPGWKVVAADTNAPMLDRGRERTIAAGLPNVSFEEADLTGDLGAERFDAILALECLLEIPDDAAAVRAMARALRPGGILLAHVPTHDWKPLLPGSDSTWRHQARHGYTRQRLAELLAQGGLEVVRIEGAGMNLGRAAQEISDRMKDRPLPVRVGVMPLLLAAVALEDRGVTWGPTRALFVEARRS
jgi:SAM-dependent methyltransferase